MTAIPAAWLRASERILAELASVRLTVILLGILIPLTIVGTLIPQGRPPVEYIGKYGWNWFRVLHFLWLTEIFKSFWFVGALLVLGLNVLTCTATRLRQKKQGWGFVLTHLSLLFLIAGGLMSAQGRASGEVKISEGETVHTFTSRGKEVPLGFELRLKDFELKKYENQGEKLIVHISGEEKPREFYFRPETRMEIQGTPYQFQVEHFVPDFRMDQGNKRVFSASNEPNNPAIYVHITGSQLDYGEWLFHRYRDFHGTPDKPLKLEYVWAPFVPKDFLSHLEVIQEGRVVREKVIEVNHPLRFGGFGIYQSSYDPVDGKWSGLEIVKDPGVWWVYIGMIGLALGMAWNIYIRPLWVKQDANGQRKEILR